MNKRIFLPHLSHAFITHGLRVVFSLLHYNILLLFAFSFVGLHLENIFMLWNIWCGLQLLLNTKHTRATYFFWFFLFFSLFYIIFTLVVYHWIPNLFSFFFFIFLLVVNFVLVLSFFLLVIYCCWLLVEQFRVIRSFLFLILKYFFAFSFVIVFGCLELAVWPWCVCVVGL